MYRIILVGIFLLAGSLTMLANIPMSDSLNSNAQFKGGDLAYYRWLDEHLDIPDSLKKIHIDGTFKARLTIDKTGRVDTNILILQSLGPLVDPIFVRAIRQSPDFIPAVVNGVPSIGYYEVVYRLSINSQLNQNPAQDGMKPDSFSLWQSIKSNRPKYDSVIMVPGIGPVILGPLNYSDKPFIIKSSLMGLWYGYLPLYLDIKLKKKISMELGGGVTFRSLNYDLFHSIISKGYTGNTQELATWQGVPNTRDEPDNYTDYTYRHAVPGFYASLALKKYTWGNGLKGLFYSPRIELAQHLFNYRKMNGSQKRDATLVGKESIFLLKPMISAGYQGFRKSFVKEILLGFGISLEQATREDLGFDLLTNQFINGQKTTKSFYPFLKLDVRMGGTVGPTKRTYATRYKVSRMMQPKIFDESHPDNTKKNLKYKNL